MLKSFKKISSAVVDTNPWWSHKRDVFETANGERGTYDYGETRASGGVMIVALSSKGELLCNKQYRYLGDKECIEFPGGGLEVGELPIDGARRELLEETGYQAGDLLYLGAFNPLSGLFKETTYIFIALGVKKSMEPKQQPSAEETEAVFYSVSAFEALVESGFIWDGQTLAAWAAARQPVLRILQQRGIV